jgi:predicted dithiol-disulfide oxidoreductase (DUF899 family)
VFRTYFLNNRGDEQMGSTWNYLDITPLGRQEAWEDSPEGWPQPWKDNPFRVDGRPIAQWSRIAAGRSDDLDS